MQLQRFQKASNGAETRDDRDAGNKGRTESVVFMLDIFVAFGCFWYL